MKRLNLLILSSLFVLSLRSQDVSSTANRVYQIFQSKCINCHSNSNPQGGLDLEGQGSNFSQKVNAVYNNLVNIQPQNSLAKSNGYKLISPGRTDQSFLFKKVNQGLDRSISLETGEKAAMPIGGSLSDVEKELIRQWIIFGAPKENIVVKESILEDYYEKDMGQASFPEGAPEAPHPSEGFQIKMGPFFIDPSGEDEYFTKFELNNPSEIEVNRLDIKMSNYSHHFIIYDYSSEALQVPDGLRTDQEHTADVSFVATVQETQNIQLPKGTAFKWGKNHVLDLNSHTINYTTDFVYQNEVYINVYTQPSGTAIQKMNATLVPHTSIFIPNNGNEITHRAKVQTPGRIFAWNLVGHTHQYGKSYKIWLNDAGGNANELVYDGSCPRGIPGCVAPFYDYQHIPTRTFDQFLPIDLAAGMTHEAKWVNDGPRAVFWGPTSEDEMMLFGMLYVTDTTGLGNALTTSTTEIENLLKKVKVQPNPMQSYTNIILPKGVRNVWFSLYNMFGKSLLTRKNVNDAIIRLNRNQLAAGMYLLKIEDKSGRSYTSKILME